MKVHFTAPHPLFGRASSPKPPSFQQRSPYYWWWAFLRRNDEYLACCARGGKGKLSKLYQAFGDVKSDNFKYWWTEGERGARLFGEKPRPVKLSELAEPSEWDESWAPDKVMVVAVPLDISKRRLQSYFAELLKKRHMATRGRRSNADLLKATADYKLYRAVSIQTLRIQLAVWDAVTRSKLLPKKKTMAQIGAELRLVPTAMPDSRDTASTAMLKRNVMQATVSRYYKDACNIIANTAKGEFPNSASN